MFSFFKGKEHDEVALIFDIGSGSIGAALIHISPENMPAVLYTHREPLTFLPQVTSRRLLSEMAKLLAVVAEHVQKEGMLEVKKMFSHPVSLGHISCIFSSPWYVSQTKIVKFEKEKEFPITKKLIEDIVEKEEEQFQAALREGKYEKIFGADTRLLEKKIIHTTLNGYEVNEPFGKKARELEVTFFTSFVSATILERVEHIIHRALNVRAIQFYSYALTSWSAARDMFPEARNFLFLDISGEMTDISLTSRGMLMETVSFPHGRNMLLRRTCEALDVSPDTALSSLIMNFEGKAEKKFSQKINTALADIKTEWLDSFKEALGKLGTEYAMPKKIFLTVDADLSRFFIEALQESMPLELGVPQNAFDVMFLGSDKVALFTHFVPKGIQDPFLSLESIFLQKILMH